MILLLLQPYLWLGGRHFAKIASSFRTRPIAGHMNCVCCTAHCTGDMKFIVILWYELMNPIPGANIKLLHSQNHYLSPVQELSSTKDMG